MCVNLKYYFFLQKKYFSAFILCENVAPFGFRLQLPFPLSPFDRKLSLCFPSPPNAIVKRSRRPLLLFPPLLLITPGEKGEVIIGRKFGGFPAQRKGIHQTYRRQKIKFFPGFPRDLGIVAPVQFRRKYCVKLMFNLPENSGNLSPIGLQYRGYKHYRGGREEGVLLWRIRDIL